MNGPPIRPHLLLFGLGNVTRPKARSSVAHVIIQALMATKMNGRLKSNRRFQGNVCTSDMSNVGHGQMSEDKGPFARITLARSDLTRCHDGVTLKRLLFEHPALRTGLPPRANLGLLLRQVVIMRESVEHAPFTLTHIPPTLELSTVKFRTSHSHTRSTALLDPRSVHQLLIGVGRPPKGLEGQFLSGNLPGNLAKYWGPGGTGVHEVWTLVEKIILGGGPQPPNPEIDSIELWSMLASERRANPYTQIDDGTIEEIHGADLEPFTHRSERRKVWGAGLLPNSSSPRLPTGTGAKPAKRPADPAVSSLNPPVDVVSDESLPLVSSGSDDARSRSQIVHGPHNTSFPSTVVAIPASKRHRA